MAHGICKDIAILVPPPNFLNSVKAKISKRKVINLSGICIILLLGLVTGICGYFPLLRTVS